MGRDSRVVPPPLRDTSPQPISHHRLPCRHRRPAHRPPLRPRRPHHHPAPPGRTSGRRTESGERRTCCIVQLSVLRSPFSVQRPPPLATCRGDRHRLASRHGKRHPAAVRYQGLLRPPQYPGLPSSLRGPMSAHLRRRLDGCGLPPRRPRNPRLHPRTGPQPRPRRRRNNPALCTVQQSPARGRKRRTESGKRKTENGEQKTENGEQKTENGERKTENGFLDYAKREI